MKIIQNTLKIQKKISNVSKKIWVGPNKVGSVGVPDMRHFFFCLMCYKHHSSFHGTWYVASGLIPIKVCSNDDPGLTLTNESIAACDLKAGRCRQLIKFMKVCEYSWSRAFLDLDPRSFTYDN